MIKVFISQPMNGKTQDEIIAERKKIFSYYDDGEHYLIDSFIENAENVNPLYCLGSAIQFLSKADLAVFAPGWENSRGCIVEHQCCDTYGIKTHHVEVLDQ